MMKAFRGAPLCVLPGASEVQPGVLPFVFVILNDFEKPVGCILAILGLVGIWTAILHPFLAEQEKPSQ